MKKSEALKVIAYLEAAYPGRELPESTKGVWGTELLVYDFEDGWEAARCLSQLTTFMPSLAEVLEGCREERNARIMRERRLANSAAKELPADKTGGFISFADWLATQPADVVERAKKVIPTATRRALKRAEETPRQEVLSS
jgi:hypothetical protein